MFKVTHEILKELLKLLTGSKSFNSIWLDHESQGAIYLGNSRNLSFILESPRHSQILKKGISNHKIICEEGYELL
jgi:hypothetical protein